MRDASAFEASATAFTSAGGSSSGSETFDPL